MQRKLVYSLLTLTALVALRLCVLPSNPQGFRGDEARQIRAELEPFVHGHPFVNLANWRALGIGGAICVTIRNLPFELHKELRMRVGKIYRNPDGSVTVQVLEGKSFYGAFNLTKEQNRSSLYDCDIQGVGKVSLR